MKLNSYSLAVVIFVLLFGGIGFSSAMNWWQTETQKEPVKFSEGEAAGQYNPADIRGSYTFGDISSLFGVPVDALAAAFRVPPEQDAAIYQAKSLEEQFADLDVEIGTASVRMFVAFYKGLPFALDAEEGTYLLEEAAAILEQQGSMTPEQAEYLRSHTTSAIKVPEAEAVPDSEGKALDGEATPAAPESGVLPTPTVHAPEAYQVTGKTTFQDLLDWGLAQEAIEALLGGEMPAPQMLVKDYATAQGSAFSELKDELQAAVDAAQTGGE